MMKAANSIYSLNKHQTFFCVLVILTSLVFFSSACQSPAAAPTPTVAVTTSPAVSAIPSLSPSPSPSAMLEEVLTPTAHPPLQKLATLGKGTAPRFFRSPDGSIIVREGPDNTIELFNAADENNITTLPYSFDFIYAISPNNRLIVVNEGSGFGVYDIATQKYLGGAGPGLGSAYAPVFTPDSRYVVFLNAENGVVHAANLICIIDTASPPPTGESETADNFGYNACYPTIAVDNAFLSVPVISPDGGLVAAGYQSDTHNILYIWDTVKRTIRFEIKDQPARITAVTFSPDGSLLATSSRDGLVRLWEPGTGKIKRTIAGFVDDIENVAFTPDGAGLIVNVLGQPKVYYDLAAGKQSFAIPRPTVDHLTVQKVNAEGYLYGRGYPTHLLFSPDGKTLAVCDDSIQLWDVQSNQQTHSLLNSAPLALLGYSPDGGLLATTTSDDNVILWNTTTGEQALSLSPDALVDPQAFLSATSSQFGPGRQGIAFSADGKSIALGSGTAITLWDIATATKTLTLEALIPAAHPKLISFSEDGALIFATFSDDSAIAVWDAASGSLVRRPDLPRIVFADSGTDVITSADDMRRWNHAPQLDRSSALHGSFFVHVNEKDGAAWVELWDLKQEKMLQLPLPARENVSLRFSPDGRFLALLAGGKMYLWQTNTGQLILVEDNVTDNVALDRDGKMFATQVRGELVTLWDIEPYTQAALADNFISPALITATLTPETSPTATPQPTQLVTTLPLPTAMPGAITSENAVQLRQVAQFGNGNIKQLSWTENGILVTTSQGLYQYDAQTLQETSRFEVPGLANVDSRLLADGRWLVAGTTPDGKIQLWDAKSNSKLTELPGNGEPAISPDGKWLVFVKQTEGLQTWNVETGRAGALLRSHWALWQKPVFSHDGQYIAAINDDRYIRIWDLATGAIVDGVGGPDSAITDLSFSADGKFIVASAGGSAWVWGLKPRTSPRNFTFYEGWVDDTRMVYNNSVSVAALDAANAKIAIGTSENNDIWIYDHASGSQLGKLAGHTSSPVRLAFRADGTQLVSVDRNGKLILWDLASFKALVTADALKTSVNGFTLRVDGRISAWGEKVIWALNPEKVTLEQTTSIPAGTILAVSPAGDLVASYSSLHVSLYDAVSGTLKQTLTEEPETVPVGYWYQIGMERKFYGAAFSPDGKQLATFGMGGIWLYDLPDATNLRRIEGNNTRSLIFGPDGGSLVASIADYGDDNTGCPNLFDTQNLQALLDLCSLENFVQNRISTDKRWIGSVSNANSPGKFRLEITEAVTESFEKDGLFDGDNPSSLAFSPNAGLVAVGQRNGKIVLVDFETMTIAATLDAHQGWISSLAFTQDGRSLISLGDDGLLKIWTAP